MAGAKRGRKSAWDTKIEPRLLEIAAWCRNGKRNIDIAKALDVNQATFYNYVKEKIELSEALKLNRTMLDITVENCLLKRAKGFTFDETTQEVRKDKDGNITGTVQKKVTKTVLPEVSALVYWLNNRAPSEWKSTNHTENRINVKPDDPRTSIEILMEAKIPLPQFNVPDITDMPSTTPTETPEQPKQIAAPVQDPGQDIEIARLKAQLASQGKLIEELQKKDEIKFVSTDDPENINSPFGKK